MKFLIYSSKYYNSHFLSLNINMSAIIIDGKDLSNILKSKLTEKVFDFSKKKEVLPGLAVIIVGDDHASKIYVKNKIKACEEVGFYSVCEKYDKNITEVDLIHRIKQLNKDKKIHGILIQLPLPDHLNPRKILENINIFKDVDGFHTSNSGKLMLGNPIFKPCTPFGVMKILEHIGFNIRGSNAVIVGSSYNVGKPQSMLLLNEGATVTICNSKTKNLSMHTSQADLLIVATGKQKLIRADMIKKNAVVIDVGINRDMNGKLCGDVDFESAKNVAGWITPVPGGVGPMTITMLLFNTLLAAELSLKNLND